MIYGECVVDTPYSVRIVRLYETKRVTTKIPRGKVYNRNKQGLFKDQNATIKYMFHIQHVMYLL